MYAKLSLPSLLSGRNLKGSYTCTLSTKLHESITTCTELPRGSPKYLVDDAVPKHQSLQMYLNTYKLLHSIYEDYSWSIHFKTVFSNYPQLKFLYQLHHWLWLHVMINRERRVTKVYPTYVA